MLAFPNEGANLADPKQGPSANAAKPADVEELHKLVMQSLDDVQALEVVSIPLAG